jgi:hypothetical protein
VGVCEGSHNRLVSDGPGSPDRPKWPLSREQVRRHEACIYRLSDVWVAQSAVLTRISGASLLRRRNSTAGSSTVCVDTMRPDLVLRGYYDLNPQLGVRDVFRENGFSGFRSTDFRSKLVCVDNPHNLRC